MSSLLHSAAGGTQGVLVQDDKRSCDEFFFGNDELFQPDQLANLYCSEDPNWGDAAFNTPWWPNVGGLVGDLGADVSMLQRAAWWGDPQVNSGCNGRFSFAGITRTAAGAPLAGATVRCFRTSTDELVAKVTSGANGYYLATTPYGDAHYLTVHASTSPPIAGASVDTLTAG